MKPESNISSSRYAETFAEWDKLVAEHIEDEEVGKHIILKQKIG